MTGVTVWLRDAALLQCTVLPVRRFAKEMYASWCEHRCGALASELLLLSLLSLLPMVLSLMALLGYANHIVGVAASAELRDWATTQVHRVIGDSPEVTKVIDSLFRNGARNTLTFGVLVTVYASSRVFTSVVGSLDVVFGCRNHRNWFTQRVAGLVLAAISMMLLPAVIVATTASQVIAKGWMNHLVGAAGYLIAVLWVAGLYHWVPKHTTTLRAQLPGAFMSVLLISVLMRFFRWYMVIFDANAVFGIIGTGVSLLWFGYFACCMFFFGAELNARRMRQDAALLSGPAEGCAE